jgi:hypothetical protein
MMMYTNYRPHHNVTQFGKHRSLSFATRVTQTANCQQVIPLITVDVVHANTLVKGKSRANLRSLYEMKVF